MNVDNIHLMAYWGSIHLVSYLAQEPIFRSAGFCKLVCGNFKVFKIRAKVILKISLVSKDAVTRLHRSCSLLVMGS